MRRSLAPLQKGHGISCNIDLCGKACSKFRYSKHVSYVHLNLMLFKASISALISHFHLPFFPSKLFATYACAEEPTRLATYILHIARSSVSAKGSWQTQKQLYHKQLASLTLYHQRQADRMQCRSRIKAYDVLAHTRGFYHTGDACSVA